MKRPTLEQIKETTKELLAWPMTQKFLKNNSTGDSDRDVTIYEESVELSLIARENGESLDVTSLALGLLIKARLK